MNQGIAFARTLRALEADDFRASKLGMLVAALVIGAWVWWLVAARVPRYESTTNVSIENGRTIAFFPSTAGIAVGQPAVLHINGTTLSGRVQSIGSNFAVLAVAPNPRSLTPASSSASADIEISRVSPATLALRSLGYSPR